MVLKKPTKAQYEALFGPLEGQIRTVLALAFEDSGEPMFVNEETASYRKFREVVAAIKSMAEKDVESGVFATSGLTCIDIYVMEVEKLFKIEDNAERFSQLTAMVRSKLRLNGHVLTDAEYDALPYSDQLIAVKSAVKDIVRDNDEPFTASAKES